MKFLKIFKLILKDLHHITCILYRYLLLIHTILRYSTSSLVSIYKLIRILYNMIEYYNN